MCDLLERYHFTDDHGHSIENCVDYQAILSRLHAAEAQIAVLVEALEKIRDHAIGLEDNTLYGLSSLPLSDLPAVARELLAAKEQAEAELTRVRREWSEEDIRAHGLLQQAHVQIAALVDVTRGLVKALDDGEDMLGPLADVHTVLADLPAEAKEYAELLEQAEAERDRLRARTQEIQEAADKKYAELHHKYVDAELELSIYRDEEKHGQDWFWDEVKLGKRPLNLNPAKARIIGNVLNDRDRLRAENERLQEALEQIETLPSGFPVTPAEIAHDALRGGKEGSDG